MTTETLRELNENKDGKMFGSQVTVNDPVDLDQVNSQAFQQKYSDAIKTEIDTEENQYHHQNNGDILSTPLDVRQRFQTPTWQQDSAGGTKAKADSSAHTSPAGVMKTENTMDLELQLS